METEKNSTQTFNEDLDLLFTKQSLKYGKLRLPIFIKYHTRHDEQPQTANHIIIPNPVISQVLFINTDKESLNSQPGI